MPRFDETGPMGEGPMTGYGRGYCILPLEEVKSPIIKKQLDSDFSPTHKEIPTLHKRNNKQGVCRYHQHRRGW